MTCYFKDGKKRGRTQMRRKKQLQKIGIGKKNGSKRPGKPVTPVQLQLFRFLI